MSVVFQSDGRPKMWYGYTDLGPIQIPTLPQYIILTDRDDGTLWTLTYNLSPTTADGYGYISINSTLPSTPDKVTFAAYEEPYFKDDSGTVRLIVRSGYLGVETLTQPLWDRDNDQQRVIARLGLSRAYRELISSILTPGEYAWVPDSIATNPNPT